MTLKLTDYYDGCNYKNMAAEQCNKLVQCNLQNKVVERKCKIEIPKLFES
jgi:(2Fe-2S) ferredoxin